MVRLCCIKKRTIFCFRNVFFLVILKPGRWIKFENPISRCVMHHHQNPIVTKLKHIYNYNFNSHTNTKSLETFMYNKTWYLGQIHLSSLLLTVNGHQTQPIFLSFSCTWCGTHILGIELGLEVWFHFHDDTHHMCIPLVSSLLLWSDPYSVLQNRSCRVWLFTNLCH